MEEVERLLEEKNGEAGEKAFATGERKRVHVHVLPVIDLRGIDFSERGTEGPSLKRVILVGAHLEGANLVGVHLEGADLKEANLEGAGFAFAHFGIIVPEWREGREETERIREVVEATAAEERTSFIENKFLPQYKELIKRWRWDLLWRLATYRWFYTDFEGANIEDADTSMAADLRRFGEDQRFVRRVRATSPALYHLWNWTTACGWAAWRAAALSIALMGLFAVVYAQAPHPPSACIGLTLACGAPLGFVAGFSWFMMDLRKKNGRERIVRWYNRCSTVYWVLVAGLAVWTLGFGFPGSWERGLYGLAKSVPGLNLLTMEPGQCLFKPADNPGVADWLEWFYVSFDIFTNLGIRIKTEPMHSAGVLLMFAETVCGWVALGLLLTVFANKVARRA